MGSVTGAGGWGQNMAKPVAMGAGPSAFGAQATTNVGGAFAGSRFSPVVVSIMRNFLNKYR